MDVLWTHIRVFPVHISTCGHASTSLRTSFFVRKKCLDVMWHMSNCKTLGTATRRSEFVSRRKVCRKHTEESFPKEGGGRPQILPFVVTIWPDAGQTAKIRALYEGFECSGGHKDSILYGGLLLLLRVARGSPNELAFGWFWPVLHLYPT